MTTSEVVRHTASAGEPLQIVQAGFSGSDAPEYGDILSCIRCGFCLPACPTYSVIGTERATPRGRIALMRSVTEWRLDVTQSFHEQMYLCLDCRACVTACPAGVPYGELVEAARSQATRRFPFRGPQKRILDFFFQLLPNPDSMERWAGFLRFYQRSGLARLGLGRLLPGPFGEWEKLLPKLPERSTRQILGEFVPATGESKGRVGLQTGCIMNVAFSAVTVATARLLARNGWEVVVPREQGCCGALQAHFGEMELSRQLAKKLIDVFDAAGVETIISDSAGCSAHMREYDHLLKDDPNYVERAVAFAGRVRDISEFLVEQGPIAGPLGEMKVRATYDDPCHLIHCQGVSAPPRQLLKEIPGLELVELREADWCCGSAGVYNLIRPEVSMQLLDRKMANVAATEAELLVTANPGCLLQLELGVKRAGQKVRVAHIVEVLEEAYQAADGQ